MIILSILIVLLGTSLAHPEATPAARTLPQGRRIHDGDDAAYSFGYAVDAPEAENFYAHEEARQGEVTRGRFRVALPDNRLQTVTYRANRDGYTAEVSYASHPDFPALRASLGPIGDAPQIGAAVVSGLRQGANWKDAKVQPRPDHGPRRPQGPSTTANAIPPIRTPTTTRPRRPSPKVPRPRPTATRATTSAPSRRPSAAPTAPPAPTKATRAPRPASPRPTASTRRPQPPPAAPTAAALFVAAEDLGDREILSRLIEAIRQKTEEEMAKEEEEEREQEEGGAHHEDDSGEKRGKPRYKIEDRASVRLRLDAIVHAAKF